VFLEWGKKKKIDSKKKKGKKHETKKDKWFSCTLCISQNARGKKRVLRSRTRRSKTDRIYIFIRVTQ